MQALQCHFYCLIILHAQQVQVIANDFVALVKFEDHLWVTRMAHIGKDKANFSSYVVTVCCEQLNYALH